VDLPPAPGSDDQRLQVVPTPALRAGVNTVQVRHPLMLGAPATTASPHGGFESNVVAFMLQPRLTALRLLGATPEERVIEADLQPSVGPRQRASLLLYQSGAAPGAVPRSFVLEAQARTADVATLRFAAAAVPAGAYVAHVRVDGAESRAAGGAAGEVTIP
jgi:hypothetical protein